MILAKRSAEYSSNLPIFLKEGGTAHPCPERALVIRAPTKRKSWFQLTQKKPDGCLDYGMNIPAVFHKTFNGTPNSKKRLPIPSFSESSIQTNSDSKNVKTLQTSIDKLSGLMDLAMDEMLFWEHQDSATTLVEVDLNDILEEYLPSQILGSIRGRGSLVPDQESWLENILQEFEKEWAHTSVPRTIAEMTLALHMPPNTAAASSRSSRNSSKGKKKPLRISWTHR